MICTRCKGKKETRTYAKGDSDSRGQPSHYMKKCWFCDGEGKLFQKGCTEADIEHWMKFVDARHLWSTPAPNGLAMIEYYAYPEGMFFLLRFSTDGRKDHVSCQLFLMEAEAKG